MCARLTTGTGGGVGAAATPGGVQGCVVPWQAPPVDATQSWTIAAEAFGVWST